MRRLGVGPGARGWMSQKACQVCVPVTRMALPMGDGMLGGRWLPSGPGRGRGWGPGPRPAALRTYLAPSASEGLSPARRGTGALPLTK